MTVSKKKKAKRGRPTRQDRATSFGIFELACNAVGISMADWYPADIREPAVRSAADMGASMNLPGRWEIRPVSAADAAARIKSARSAKQPKPKRKKRAKKA